MKGTAQEALETILKGRDFTVPINLDGGKRITLTASPVIFENIPDSQMGNSRRDFMKSFRVALEYGYVGLSEGKRNGIVNIRDEDKTLLADYAKMMSKHRIPAMYSLGCPLIPVKLVAHIPSGNRFIGCLDGTQPETNPIVIFALSNYNKRMC